jgi:beta-phosphoglucomutase
LSFWSGVKPVKRESAVIFDMDGVLIDSAADHLRSWRVLAGELGVEVSDEDFLRTFGRQNRDVIPMLFGSGRTREEIDRLGDHKEAIYRELVRGRVPAIGGAVALVRRCAAGGFKLAIGSSGHPENIALALEELGVSEFFAAVVSSDDVSRGKPDPAVFLCAARKLGVTPCRCVVIEDAPAGIEAALAADMAAVALARQHPRSKLARAHLVVDTLEEVDARSLFDLLKKVSAKKVSG